MNFFNIDLHVSVIEDIKNIFYYMNHNVNSILFSEHAFILNKQTQHSKIINKDNWKLLDINMCNSFYNEYKNLLSSFDGFICTYPPSFSLLYEKFDKPIIIQSPIRMEVPFQHDKKRLNWFIDYIKNNIDNKKIIPIANSLYEKKYCEELTEREWLYIPNYCDYTNSTYNRRSNKYILFSLYKFDCNDKNIVLKEKAFNTVYEWRDLYAYKGIVHIPYNVSTMSIFEQYTANVPLLFPSLDFLINLENNNLALQQISWTSNKKNTTEWLQLSDFYNKKWMPYIIYFNSFKNLKDIINNLNDDELYNISNKMKIFNIERKKNIYNRWEKIFKYYFGVTANENIMC